MILLGGGADAQQTSPIPLKRMMVQGDFAVSEGVAVDISGMACLPQGAPRKCLLINDENKNAQFATIDNDRMVVGDVVPLIGSTADPRTLGSPPDETCERRSAGWGTRWSAKRPKGSRRSSSPDD